jgi:hypothetical protein
MEIKVHNLSDQRKHLQISLKTQTLVNQMNKIFQLLHQKLQDKINLKKINSKNRNKSLIQKIKIKNMFNRIKLKKIKNIMISKNLKAKKNRVLIFKF